MIELNSIMQGNCLDVLKKIDDNSIDSIITDSPYELGFMGKRWDSTGIAYNIEMWKECLRVLKPGGHLLSFGGTRTYHRMACAIEDAGFEVRDMIEWVYGSGFPKSLSIGKSVDKLQGNEREVIGEKMGGTPKTGLYEAGLGVNEGKYIKDTKGTSEWEGWGTALKPAHEPICMARKPLSEKTVAENCLKWGTGGINIDESRVGTEDNTSRKVNTAGHFSSEEIEQRVNGGSELGRFPANLILEDCEEVRECFPESKSIPHKHNHNQTPSNIFDSGTITKGEFESLYSDSGNASRFFKSIIYQAKASKAERNKGCEGLEVQSNMRVNAPRENEEEKTANKMGNHHPTIKPIALMEYLIKMVTPKGGTVLDPFSGSGSTLVAAKKNGFKYIGIELESDYIEIIKARLNAVDETETNLSLF